MRNCVPFASVLLVGFGLASIVEGAILVGPMENPTNHHIYYLLTTDTWTNSEAQAVVLGGHLATINDADENAWIVANFGDYDGISRALWTGLNDVALEGAFVWASGESVTYTHWYTGEPNNNAGIEDWVHIFPSSDYLRYGYWNDAPDSASAFGYTMFGVVEVSGASGAVPEPAATAVWSLLGAIGIASGWWRRRKTV